MGQLIPRNWNLREFCVWVNSPPQIREVRVPIRPVITPLWGYSNPIRQVVPLICHNHSHPLHCIHLHPPSLSFLSTTLPSSQNTKWSHSSLSIHVMIMIWHRVKHTPSVAFPKYNIHWVQHSPSTAFTVYSIHRVKHPPKTVCLPVSLIITNRPLNVASASGLPPYMIDSDQPALHERSKLKSHSQGCELTNWWEVSQHPVCHPSTVSMYITKL